MTRFFVDQAGVYMGGFDGAEPPVGAVEVPSAPDHAADLWAGGAWEPNVQARAVQEIARLEGTITSRRMREAVLSQAGADWLAAVEAAIAAERAKL